MEAGQANFLIDDTEIAGTPGDILVAPAGSAHRFISEGTGRLRLTAIHTASTMDTEWLEAADTRA